MENILLAIVTDDKEYGRALSLAMLSICRNFIISMSGTHEFFRKVRNFDLVLWDGREACDVYGGKLVYLAEKPSDVIRNVSGRRFCIYKYSSADCIVTSIFEIYETVTGRRAMNMKRQEVRLLGFLSSTGGAGCTAVAAAFGQEISRFRGEKVLYLSFEEIESTGSLMQCHAGLKGAGVYLYHLFKEQERQRGPQKKDMMMMPFLDGYMIRDDFGMEAFAPTQGRNPLRELNPDEIAVFLSAVMDSGRYDVIIMDLGQWLASGGLACIDMADKLCYVGSYRDDRAREEQYISHLVSRCGETILDKIVKVSNMMPDQGGRRPEQEEESSMLENHMNISRCRSILRDGTVRRIMLEGSFGNEISRLAEKLTEPA